MPIKVERRYRKGPKSLEPKPAPGNLAIVQDFVNTAGIGGGPDGLATPKALARWLTRRGLLAAGVEFGERKFRAALRRRRAARGFRRGGVGALRGCSGSAGRDQHRGPARGPLAAAQAVRQRPLSPGLLRQLAKSYRPLVHAPLRLSGAHRGLPPVRQVPPSIVVSSPPLLLLMSAMMFHGM